jgi:hypothetical protein
LGLLWAFATFPDIDRANAIPISNIDFMQVLPNDDGKIGIRYRE